MDPPSQIHAKWMANENDNNLRTNNQINPSGWKEREEGEETKGLVLSTTRGSPY